MAARTRGLGKLFIVLFFGLLMGGALGEVLGHFLPDGVVKEFFVRSISAGIGPAELNLHAIAFTLGFSFKVNVMSVVGVILAAYYFRWY
jgi:hypothetical protein